MTNGTQHMSFYLKKQIEKMKGTVKTGEFVESIQNLEKGCIIQTSKDKIYEADYVIMALPPCNIKKIKFSPDLSVQRKLINNKNLLGQCTKLILLY